MKAATFILALVQFVVVCKRAEESPPSTLLDYFAFLVLIALPLAALFPFFYSSPEPRPKSSPDQ